MGLLVTVMNRLPMCWLGKMYSMKYVNELFTSDGYELVLYYRDWVRYIMHSMWIRARVTVMNGLPMCGLGEIYTM